MHVEAEITKGKYNDYDIFLGEEAALYLKLYLDERKRGAKNAEYCAPSKLEELTDNSPLIQAANSTPIKGITERTFEK